MKQKQKKLNNEITEIGITKDSLTGRGGLALILRYLKNIGIIPIISKIFAEIRKSRKGRDIEAIISQLICYFIDGSKQTMTRFDELAESDGYSKTIETAKEDMCSSHIIKRFFKSSKEMMFKRLQNLLLELFIWRLKIEKPKIIILGIDTMVLDNDDAKKREGVSFTYKKVNGYHPLHIYWKGYVVNMAFHEGSEAPNHGNDLFETIEATVKIIRKKYNRKVKIIVVSDSGFFGEQYFNFMDKLKVYFICGGMIIDQIKLNLMLRLQKEWRQFEVDPDKSNTLEYLDFRDKRHKWKQDRRAIYTKQMDKNGQFHLEFDRPENIIYTNLEKDNLSNSIILKKYLEAEEIIRLYRMRAKDELVNRGIKEFSDETLPFKSFVSNGVYYYLSLISFNLLTAFQKDTLAAIPLEIPVGSYPDTIRRLFIDIAGKVVKSGRKIILKFESCVYERLKLGELWNKCCESVPLVC